MRRSRWFRSKPEIPALARESGYLFRQACPAMIRKSAQSICADFFRHCRRDGLPGTPKVARSDDSFETSGRFDQPETGLLLREALVQDVSKCVCC